MIKRTLPLLSLALLSGCFYVEHDYPPAPPKKANLVTVRQMPKLGASYVTVTPPADCPNWSKWSHQNVYNTDGSNLGCATTTNFGQMVADPRDLISGGPGTPPTTDALRHQDVMTKYRSGELPAIGKVEATSDQ